MARADMKVSLGQDPAGREMWLLQLARKTTREGVHEKLEIWQREAVANWGRLELRKQPSVHRSRAHSAPRSRAYVLPWPSPALALGDGEGRPSRLWDPDEKMRADQELFK